MNNITSTPDVLCVSICQERELQNRLEKLKKKNDRLVMKKALLERLLNDPCQNPVTKH